MIFWLSFKLANYTPYTIIVYPRAAILCVQKAEFLIELYLHRVFITTAHFGIFIDSHVHAVLAEHIMLSQIPMSVTKVQQTFVS